MGICSKFPIRGVVGGPGGRSLVRIPYCKFRRSNRTVATRATPQNTCIVCQSIELDTKDILLQLRNRGNDGVYERQDNAGTFFVREILSNCGRCDCNSFTNHGLGVSYAVGDCSR